MKKVVLLLFPLLLSSCGSSYTSYRSLAKNAFKREYNITNASNMSCNIKGKNGEPGPKVFDIESHDFLVFLDGVLSEMEFMEVESFYEYETKYIKEKTLVYSFTGTAFDDGEKYGFYELFFAPNNVGAAFLYELGRPSEKKTYALSNDISEDIQARVGEELAKYIPQE